MFAPLVLLQLPAIVPKEHTSVWWHDLALWHDLFACIESADLWYDFRFESAFGTGRFHAVESLDAVKASAVTWKAGNHTLTMEKGEHALDRALNLSVSASALGVQYSVRLNVLEGQRETLIGQCIAFVTCLHDSLSDQLWFGMPINVAVEGLMYPRPRPPRRDVHFGASALVDFISLPYHEQHDTRRREDVQKLRTAPLPDGIKRQEKNGLVVIRWIDDLTDATLIAARLSMRQQWMNWVLNPPIEASYNSYGDLKIVPKGLVRHEAVTLYGQNSGRGYKALYVDTSGGVDEREFAELESLVHAGVLPDGSTLRELYLIAPDRTRAVAIHERARKIGVAAVYYPADDGTWFDPFPPGLWLDDEGSTT